MSRPLNKIKADKEAWFLGSMTIYQELEYAKYMAVYAKTRRLWISC
jgi:hypothetical protein